MTGEELFLNELNFRIQQGISRKDLAYLANERLKQLTLTGVSQQRELLKAYDHFAEQKHCWYLGTTDETKEDFLKSL